MGLNIAVFICLVYNLRWYTMCSSEYSPITNDNGSTHMTPYRVTIIARTTTQCRLVWNLTYINLKSINYSCRIWYQLQWWWFNIAMAGCWKKLWNLSIQMITIAYFIHYSFDINRPGFTENRWYTILSCFQRVREVRNAPVLLYLFTCECLMRAVVITYKVYCVLVCQSSSNGGRYRFSILRKNNTKNERTYIFPLAHL